jgi:hypothetical protein
VCVWNVCVWNVFCGERARNNGLLHARTAFAFQTTTLTVFVFPVPLLQGCTVHVLSCLCLLYLDELQQPACKHISAPKEDLRLKTQEGAELNKKKAFITLCSTVVPLQSTEKADRNLDSEFRWHRSFYSAYERMLKVKGEFGRVFRGAKHIQLCNAFVDQILA